MVGTDEPEQPEIENNEVPANLEVENNEATSEENIVE
jgi:hypothetical protein